MKKRITTIGGGTGQFIVLKALRDLNIHLTSVVSMVDNGGSTGKLRDEFGFLPPGDLRRCLVSLSRESEVLRKLFEYRFNDDCLGNMIIASLQDIVGKENYVQEASKILSTKGIVLPITIKETNVYGKTNKGRELKKQTNVSYDIGEKERIEKLWLKPKCAIFKKAEDALKKSDIVIICPGDLYGSIIPNFLVSGVNEAIQKSKAKIVYICNLVTKQGTYGFKAGDFVSEIEKYLGGGKIDIVVLNKKKPSQKTVDKYKGENSFFVEPDIIDSQKKVIKENLLLEHKANKRIIARHNPEKIKKIIQRIIRSKDC